MLSLQINNITCWQDYIAVALGFLLLLFTSGKVVSYLLKQITKKDLKEAAGTDEKIESEQKKRLAAGRIIGKCENIIILSFILMQAYTALALVITAKTLVRKEEIEKNEIYFLAGTLANVGYSVLLGFILSLVMNELNC